jgi:hypothetical protein
MRHCRTYFLFQCFYSHLLPAADRQHQKAAKDAIQNPVPVRHEVVFDQRPRWDCWRPNGQESN